MSSSESDYSPSSSTTSLSSFESAYPSPKFATSRGFPILSPNHPLRDQLYGQRANTASPLHMPKGHFVDWPVKSYFAATEKLGNGVLTKSYRLHPSSLSIARFLRIPRRLRPLLLFCVCIVTLCLFVFNRALSEARAAKSLAMQKQESLGRRHVHIEGVYDINDRKQHRLLKEAEQARTAETDVQSSNSERQMLRFESSEQELTALISFVTSTTANVIPNLDLAMPLDPSLVLDFDPYHPNARRDLAILQLETNALYPLVLFGRMRDPRYREIKSILSKVKITPPLLTIEVDQRRDHKVFIPTIARLLGTFELPQLTLEGKVIGNYKEIMSLHTSGALNDKLQENGSVLVKELKKKKSFWERERMENERVLGPAPIVDAF
ncbi:hypothetical protein L204_101561 [Cryptococcus depauperatus]